MILTAVILFALQPALQSKEADVKRRTPLVPAATAQPAGATATLPAAAAPPAVPQQTPPFDRAVQTTDPGSGPRPLAADAPPFTSDRPLFLVDGLAITAFELNELVLYYRSFRPGADDVLLIDAFAALLPMKVMQANFTSNLEPMRQKISAARAALDAGRPFAEVVKDFSDDGEAEDPEGKYTFGRERAVQPFDRVSFSAPSGAGVTGPWLTVYGWHLIEPLSYERGATAKEDKTTMRHVLAMYPRLLEIERGQGDVRAWIREQVAAAKIKVLEPGLANLVPPERRSQVVR